VKVITPEGEKSKVVYVFSQTGRQQLEQAGKRMTTTLSTNASRFEFITIQEILEAQRAENADEELVAQFLRCDEEVLAGTGLLPAPFAAENILARRLVAVPFAVYYFANWLDQERPVFALPVSLFSGQPAPDLLRLMRAFPLALDGLQVVIEPNISLPVAYTIAAHTLEQLMANEETGRTGLIWCDTALQQERDRRSMGQDKQSITWEHLQVEAGRHQILGLQPLEYLSLAVVMVPFVVMAFREPVQGCGFGILDPVLGNMHLTAKEIEV
jgi:hypothetical protein